jgi:G6PDH family F420-dependent oxidoreductase
MIEIGITLSSEERSPNALVEDAVAAEDAGFGFAMISDHFHPWIGRQGESPFVWSVLGAVFQATERLVVGTGVTCPIGRMHPAVVAQAAATTAELAPGRFVLGVGSGEALNEHITGDRWPSPPERRRRLEDAIKAIRALWSGDLLSFHGEGFDVIEARLYTRPAQPPPLLVAASGEESATLAGVLGDGMIGTSPEPAIIEAFDRAGGVGKPREVGEGK